MTQQWPQSRAPFASPPSAGLPYPSYTPYPSRTNTPAYTVSQSSSSSSNSFGQAHSVSHSSIGKGSKSNWKALLQPKRSQTAPWKGTPYIGSRSHSNLNPNSSEMSYMQYYQQAPGWATSQYEPLPPPMPSYHPTSNCKHLLIAGSPRFTRTGVRAASASIAGLQNLLSKGGGYDYYAAHSGETDR
jgi:hypothetical protein